MPRAATPETRLACARHAASELATWFMPENAPADWLPSARDVLAKAHELYPAVEISEDEARTAIGQVAPRVIRS